jgi:hypothetical protein
LAFGLTCIPITAQPRSMGYWKHQVNVHLTNKGHAQESLSALLGYIGLLVQHFNENIVNPVIIYQPAGGTQDQLTQLRQLLTLNQGATMLDRAKQQLLSLLLNVVSGKISQTEVISDNGATVAQAITHSHDLIVDGMTSNDESAKTICDLINNGQRVPSGTVPADTRMVTYRRQSVAGERPTEMTLGKLAPHPVRGAFTVELALPADGDATLEVFDITGRRVFQRELSLGAGRHQVQIEQGATLPAGAYMLRLTQSGRTVSKRFVSLD